MIDALAQRSRRATGVALLSLLSAFPCWEAAGQDRGPPLWLAVDGETGDVSIRIDGLLEEPALRDALESGLPVRLRIAVQLWKDRFFDSEEGRTEWRATVHYEPLERTYRVEVSSADFQERVLATLDEVTDALERAFEVPLRPRSEGRYYYLGQVELETLSLSDLEELRRWLRGDLEPQDADEDDTGGSVARGVGRLVVRALGLPARRFRVQTPKFDFGGSLPAR